MGHPTYIAKAIFWIFSTSFEPPFVAVSAASTFIDPVHGILCSIVEVYIQTNSCNLYKDCYGKVTIT